MKKIIIWCIIVAMLFTLTSCGNMSMGFGNFSFKHIHFTDMAHGYCATVNKWYDNENGIEVQTVEYETVYCSEGSYILFEDGAHCPFCHEGLQ